jgi:hypothetical protein
LASEHASPDFPGQPVGAPATRLFINTTTVASLRAAIITDIPDRCLCTLDWIHLGDPSLDCVAHSGTGSLGMEYALLTTCFRDTAETNTEVCSPIQKVIVAFVG